MLGESGTRSKGINRGKVAKGSVAKITLAVEEPGGAGKTREPMPVAGEPEKAGELEKVRKPGGGGQEEQGSQCW